MSHGPIPRSLLPDSTELSEIGTSIGGCNVAELAAEFGTPLFIYDEATVRARCREAVAGFDKGVAYASKAFLCGAMARLAIEEGLYLDVATGGEYDIARRAGVPASRLILHGNNKALPDLTRALDEGVHRIVVDSFDEIERLTSLVPAREVHCLVRVTPGVEAHTHEFVQTGQEDSKFGFSIASGDARRAITQLQGLPRVTVHGVHAHIGSQIFETEGFLASLRVLVDFVRHDAFDELCVGGGLGVAYVEGEAALTITEWARALREAATALGLSPNVRLTAEPGRAIVAQAGLTVYRVGTIKHVAARSYLSIDGGMSDNPRPVLYGSGYEVFDVAHPLAARTAPYRVVGSHCESGDLIVDEGWLPAATGVGSLVATPVTGAYGYAMASTYNRMPRPAVVFVADGRARLVLRRETFDDLARLEVEAH